jgi:starch phosphorylase
MESERLSFGDSVEKVKATSAFTTHTPVPAGNETFDLGLVRTYAESWGSGIPGGVSPFVDLGRGSATASDFNMTVLAIRSSSKWNGVSKLHGQVADAMWRHLFPESDGAGEQIGAITNGVHTPTWMGPEMGAVLRRHLGDDVQRRLLEPGFADEVLAIPDREVWDAHAAQKARLLTLARERVLQQLARHGRSPEELRRVQSLLSPDVLTLGFARRFATYKRADLIFRDLARLKTLMTGSERPVQIVFAGKAHPADKPGQDMLRKIFEVAMSADFWGHVVLLENYDMGVARFLVQGVDVWVNTPRRPLEASGTSGMKAAANGGLNLSVLDGWWAEGYEPAVGFAIGRPHDYDDAGAQDAEDAESLYRVLADEVAPVFYERDPQGLPVAWIGRMKRSIAKLAPRFSTERMVRDYAVGAYVPLMRRGDRTVDEERLWAP